jgi:hypothetical protein
MNNVIIFVVEIGLSTSHTGLRLNILPPQPPMLGLQACTTMSSKQCPYFYKPL